ncbi:MAG: deoxyhypusine synthase family protein, partial [Acidobacteriota bacterium]
MAKTSRFLQGPRIEPQPIAPKTEVARLVDGAFLAYNAGRLHDACQLFSRKMLKRDVTVGLSLTGALTPAGIGRSCIVPLLRAGFVDWIVST